MLRLFIYGVFLRLTRGKDVKEDQMRRRRPRSDGRKNRERLLETARTAFGAGEIDIPLDEIARRTGVGIGTLYRHFPNRDALIEAVYRDELNRLAVAATHLAETQPPVEALRVWLILFVDYIATKQVIAPALNSLLGGTDEIYADSRTVLTAAIDGLVARAMASGDIRPDIEPVDLLCALGGISNYATGPGWEARAKRLVDVLIVGSRP
ncbi:TetR family transcriptional regulator [Acetobacter ghanensis]|uniref:TetR family transcriptional regulator n=2 Tax=Acetobacter ghanensis TaxID=431306 RepID=A0A0U5BK21_9PROT|nr:TetR family transcriptional regulator [Acetobacter ghanensis]GBQ48759.1 TetR family transcriptional regulator [Acetobacter ghanensis DSM 18895]CEF56267.1 TetR family transcriptional regulator [Acetobacter ghanensis]